MTKIGDVELEMVAKNRTAKTGEGVGQEASSVFPNP